MKCTQGLLYVGILLQSFHSRNLARRIQTSSKAVRIGLTRLMATSDAYSFPDDMINGVNWIDLKIPAAELRPDYTLIMGQCFNWRRIDSANLSGDISSCWVGILGAHPIAIRQTDDSTYFAHLLNRGGVMRSTADNCSVKIEGTEKAETEATLGAMLRNYFQTDYSLGNLYQTWGTECDRMQVVTDTLKGVRVVRQDPFECLISFICSSNNNIKRISLMLDRLRCRYGRYVCTVSNNGSADGAWQVSVIDGHGAFLRDNLMKSLVQSPNSKSSSPLGVDDEAEALVTPKSKRGSRSVLSPEEISPDSFTTQEYHIFEFPSIESLASAGEAELRALGMGYRAKFISGSAAFLTQQEGGGSQWLATLRSMSRLLNRGTVGSGGADIAVKLEIKPEEKIAIKSDNSQQKHNVVDRVDHEIARLSVQSSLMLMPGVGRKVADCVALFSLDQTEAIPVDTHVWDIALRDYDTLKTLKAAKSLTPAIYEEVGAIFRQKFPIKSGWAHSVLFAAELPEFRKLLPSELQSEMKSFLEHTKSAKKADTVIKNERRAEKESVVKAAKVVEDKSMSSAKKRLRMSPSASLSLAIEETPSKTRSRKKAVSAEKAS